MKFSARHMVLMEVVGFACLPLAIKLGIDPLTWRFSGPISLLITLAVLGFYRHARGQGWRELGLRPLRGMRPMLLLLPQALLAFIAILGTGVLLSLAANALDIGFMQQHTDAMAKRLGDIKGNVPLYLLWVAIAWISAGFAEETFFRGFLISRLLDAFAPVRFARAWAVGLAALFFGALHMYYQGLRGLVVGSAIGLVLGILFLAYKRNLWPLMIGHAMVDTLAITAHFMDWDI